MTAMQRQVAITGCRGRVEGDDLLSSFQRAVAFSRAHGVFRFFNRPARTLADYALL